jgi:hypothetical protein
MTRLRERLVWLTPPAAVALILWIALASPDRAFSVPVNQGTAPMRYLAQIKGILDDGHQSSLLPWLAPVDFVIVRAAGLVGREVGGTANLSWLVMLMLGGTSAAWCSRRLGLSVVGACVMGVLYALSPFALYWNLELPGVMPYLVPFAATAALALATGALQSWPRRDVMVMAAGNLLLGLNGREYAYFGAFLILIDAIGGAVRSRRVEMRSALVAAVIVGATLVSLMSGVRAPQLPPDPNYRVTASDAEAGGVKIRQLVGPLPWHWLPPLGTWSTREAKANFPYESANHWSRLGMVGAVGFLGLLVTLLIPAAAGPPPRGDTVRAAAGLTLAAFLVATVGGLGSIISLLIAPEVLVFTRITPFFIFFSLVAVGCWVDWAAIGRRRGQWLWAAVAILGLLDQMVAISPMHRGVAKARMEYRQLQGFVKLLERQLPAGAKVFQLPNRSAHFYRRGVRSGPSDHLKFDLVSHQLSWRYPLRTDADVRRDAPHEPLEPGALPAQLARDGFAAIVVDRLGYDDTGEGVLATLQATGRTTVLAQTERYVAYVIQR